MSTFIRPFVCKLLLLTTCIGTFSAAWATDEIKISKRQFPSELQDDYQVSVLEAAMIATQKEYGDYAITKETPAVTRQRAIMALKRGTEVNVLMETLKEVMSEELLVVPIPIRRGILNYRLAIIHKDNIARFAAVKTTDDLRKLQAAMYNNSATLNLLRKQNYKPMEVPNALLMFPMLDRKRYDYTVRGVHEIYDEMIQFGKNYPDLIIEPSLTIVIPMPTVLYVSPKYPSLAARLELGLERIIKNGQLKAIFDKYYMPEVLKSNLQNRRVINIHNPLMDKVKFREIPGMLFEPKEIAEYIESQQPSS